jgi:transcriptional regulator of acetoin/glycerol metabolism
LRAYDWPGNIRELRNVLERARLFADDGLIRLENLPETLLHAVAPAAQPSADRAMPSGLAARTESEIRRLVAEGRHTRRDIAMTLGLSERTLYRRLKDLGLL